MRAVIYARFSSHNQTEQSIEGQLRDCYSYAKANEIQVIGEYIDRALSAKTDNRPQFQKMIKDSEKGLFDIVLVWKLDRFSRNRYDSATYKAKLRRNGVNVVSCMEQISDNAEGILVESLLEGMAEYYSAELAEKVARGMRETALKCKVTGGYMLLGYKSGADGHYEIDESTAPMVRKMFELYASGTAPKDIYAYLNERGFRSSKGARFNKNSLRRILSNRRYTGVYMYKDIVIPGGMPRIIEDDIFERVQKMLNKNKTGGGCYKARQDYILQSKLFCGHCKTMMVGECGRGKLGEYYYYYSCGKRKRSAASCDKKPIRKEYIENLVVENIYYKVLQDDIIEQIADRVMEIQSSEKSDGILEALTANLAETERSIKNVMTAIEQGIVTSTTKTRLEELESLREDIRYKIQKEKVSKPKFEREMVIYMLDSFRDGDINDIAFRKRLINTFVNKIYLYDDKLLLVYNYSNKDTHLNEEKLIDIVEGECSDMSLIAPPSDANLNSTKVYFLSGLLVVVANWRKITINH